MLKEHNIDKKVFSDICNKIKFRENNLKKKDVKFNLKEILLLAINDKQHTRKVFAREAEMGILEGFVQKAVDARHLLSHLHNKPIEHFNKQETKLAIKKFELLFRLWFLDDIGLDITEESLDYCISVIERELY